MSSQAYVPSSQAPGRGRRRRHGAASETVHVLISEVIFDSPDGSICWGRYSGTRIDASGRRIANGPQAVPIGDALDWAAEMNARVIVVRTGLDHREFSAGAQQPPGKPLPPWAAMGLAA